MKAQNVIKLSFILTTLVLASVVFATLSYYYGVFFAVRGLQLSIQHFNVTVSNATVASMSAVATVQNPSGFAFMVREAHESLYLDNDFVLATTPSSLPEVKPYSNVSLQFVAYVPKNKMSLVAQPGEKAWILYTRITLEGPLVGIFRLSDYKYASS